MALVSTELAKIEANACIVQGHLEMYTQFNKAVYLLREAGASQEEIDQFVEDRSKAAMQMLQVYKY